MTSKFFQKQMLHTVDKKLVDFLEKECRSKKLHLITNYKHHKMSNMSNRNKLAGLQALVQFMKLVKVIVAHHQMMNLLCSQAAKLKTVNSQKVSKFKGH